MAPTLVYEGDMSGAAITAALTNAGNAIAIPTANGQQVIVIEEI